MFFFFFLFNNFRMCYFFLNSWHCVGFINNINKNKPYVINIGELPLVFWNDGSNFYSTINICKHMGSKLGNDILNNDGSLQCQYHGLKYKPEDCFGKTMVFENKLFWSFEPTRKNLFLFLFIIIKTL